MNESSASFWSAVHFFKLLRLIVCHVLLWLYFKYLLSYLALTKLVKQTSSNKLIIFIKNALMIIDRINSPVIFNKFSFRISVFNLHNVSYHDNHNTYLFLFCKLFAKQFYFTSDENRIRRSYWGIKPVPVYEIFIIITISILMCDV